MAKLIGAVLVSFILVLPGAAGASCAWVLWEDSVFSDGSKTWKEWRPEGFPSHEQCRVAIRRMANGLKGQPGLKVKGDVVESTGRGMLRSTRLSCLPDTIDPRGAKAK